MQDLIITLLQADQKWQDKKGNLDHFTELIDTISQPTDLIILPEMFSTGFSMHAQELYEEMHGESVTWMKKIAQSKSTTLLGSLIIKEGNSYFNRIIVVNPSGIVGTYDKRHLFRMASEHLTYTPGQSKFVFEIKGWKICPFVCYDLRFPIWSRNTYSTENGWSYDLAIFVANWPAVRSYPWKMLAIARAIENQSYVATVNRVGLDGNGYAYSGDSQVINSYGEVLTLLEKDEYAHTMTLDRARLEKHRTDFPVGMDMDRFEISI